VSAVITLFGTFRTVGIRLFCKHERLQLIRVHYISLQVWLTAAGFHIVASMYLRFQYSYSCTVLRFYAPSYHYIMYVADRANKVPLSV